MNKKIVMMHVFVSLVLLLVGCRGAETTEETETVAETITITETTEGTTNQETATAKEFADEETETEEIHSEIVKEEDKEDESVEEFTVEADDKGFYINGEDISSIRVPEGTHVYITFQVRSKGVYYGGLDFRGCGESSGGTKPGKSTEIEFTASDDCKITSYWPSSGIAKDTLHVLME